MLLPLDGVNSLHAYKVWERIYIGDDITVTVLALHCGKIRIGIEAPHDIKVLREELVIEADHEERADTNVSTP